MEEAVQHELDTLRKLVLELTTRGQSSSSIPTVDSVTFEQLSSEIQDLKEYNATIRGLNTKVSDTNTVERDKAISLASSEALRRYAIIDADLADLKSALRSADEVVDQRAQAANDALERRLDLSIKSVMDISTIRYDSSQLAVIEVRSAVLTATQAAQKALESALIAAKSEVQAVRAEVMLAVNAHKELTNQRAEMADAAIAKAEASSEKRFDSVNEFRNTLSDQQKTFLPRSESDERFNSVIGRGDTMASAISTLQLDLKSTIKREDLLSIQTDIKEIRNLNATNGGKQQTWAIVGSAGLSILAIIVVLYAGARHDLVASQPAAVYSATPHP